MRFFAVVKQHKLLFLTLLLVVFIIGLMLAIFAINILGNSGPNKSITLNYAGYDQFKQQIAIVAQDPDLGQSPHFAKFLNYIQPIEDTSKSEKDKYTGLDQASSELILLYVNSGNHKAYTLLSALGTFAKNNFKKYYQPYAFTYYCEDPSCSNDKPAQDFLNIISELKNSDFPTDIKTDMSQYLLSVSYAQKNDIGFKSAMFFQTATIIKSYSSMTKTGANIKISTDLYSYIQTHYPSQYKTLVQSQAVELNNLKRIRSASK